MSTEPVLLLAPLTKGVASGFCERGVLVFSEQQTKSKTPRSPSAHDPLIRGSAPTPRSPSAHDPLIRGSAPTPRSPSAHDPLVRGSAPTPRSPSAHDPLVRGSEEVRR